MEEFGCQTRLCLKCRKEIIYILEENERLKNENQQLQKSLTEANQVITRAVARKKNMTEAMSVVKLSSEVF